MDKQNDDGKEASSGGDSTESMYHLFKKLAEHKPHVDPESKPIVRIPNINQRHDQLHILHKNISQGKSPTDENGWAGISETRKKSYANIADLNKSLKIYNKFKVDRRHSLSIAPSIKLEESTMSHHHPFKMTQEERHSNKIAARTRMSMVLDLSDDMELEESGTFPGEKKRKSWGDAVTKPKGKAKPQHLMESSGESMSQSLRLDAITCKSSTEKQKPRPSVINMSKSSGSGGLAQQGKTLDRSRSKDSKLTTKKSGDVWHGMLNKWGSETQGQTLIIKSNRVASRPGHNYFAPSHQGDRWRKFTNIHSRQVEQTTSHEWTAEDQGEYILFNTIFNHRPERRRSIILRKRWKKAFAIIGIIRQFCEVIARSSIEMQAHLKTFADIGDQAATETGGKDEYSPLDTAFKSKKNEPGELTLSTKVQVLMTHPPETRSTDEVTLILCDLQCFPSFCAYPLPVQNKIARYGMFLPVGKRRVIIRQGHEALNWYFVMSGQAIETETETHEDGTQTQNTVKFITQGQTFGEEAIVNNTTQPFTVTSRKNMQLLWLDREYFDEVQHRIRLEPAAVPEHIEYMIKQPFMKYFPYEVLLKHPSMCCQYYHRPNTVLVANSVESEWIYVIRSGSCVVQMYVDSIRASWRDLELALSHPMVNVNGYPLPRTDTGPGRLPKRSTAYTLYQRMSAQDITASDLNQVPALHMTRGGAKNVRHGLHLLVGGDVNTLKCPWPLDFFNAMNRTAFTISQSPIHFPICLSESQTSNTDTDSPSFRVRLCSADNTASGQKYTRLDVSRNALLDKRLPSRKTITSSSAAADRKGSVSPGRKASRGNVDGISTPRKASKTKVTPDATSLVSEDISLTRMGSQSTLMSGVDLIGQRDVSDKSSEVRVADGWEQKQKEKGQSEKDKEQPLDEYTKVPSLTPHPSSSTIKRSRKKPEEPKPTSYERRKNYVIPDHCKPPVPPSFKPKVPPYDCVSPPVYIHIDILTEGDHFGLDQLHEPGWERRDQSGTVALISRGAEVVTLNKRFFMSFADDKAQVAIREHMRIYPTQKAVQTRYRLQLAWELYSSKMLDEFGIDVRNRGKKTTGTFFQENHVPMGDPYAILKEEGY